MKKYIILFIIINISYLCKSQDRFVFYEDNNSRLNISDTSLPKIAITGNYDDISNLPNLSVYLTKTSVPNILSKSDNFTIVDSCFHAGKPPILHMWFDCTSSDLTVTLPSYSTFIGYTIAVGKSDSTVNTLTISGLTFNNVIGSQNTSKTVIATPTGWFQN